PRRTRSGGARPARAKGDACLQTRRRSLVETGVEPACAAGGDAVGHQLGAADCTAECQAHERADQPLAIPAYLQLRREPADLRAHHCDAVVVELLAQEQAGRLALVETERDDPRAVGAGTDRLVQGRDRAGSLDAYVGAAALGLLLDLLCRVAAGWVGHRFGAELASDAPPFRQEIQPDDARARMA